MTKKTKKMAKVSKKSIKQSSKKKNLQKEEEKGFNTTQLLTAGFLGFIVFSSKGIIIYNEEILVALGFLGFIFFVSKQYGKDIKGSLELRGIGVKQKVAEGLENTKSSQADLRDIWTSFNFNADDLSLLDGQITATKKDKILTQKALGWGFVSSTASENFTSWFSQVLVGGLSGSLKSSLAHGSWGLLKGNMGGGSSLESWSGSFRQRACGKAYQALESGDKAIQDKWVSMSLAGVSKMSL